MQYIEKLAFAIAEREGWYPVGDRNHPLGSITYRNHNPGALRASPFAICEQDSFSVFRDDLIGMHALIWDITMKCKGQTVTGLNGDSTLAQLIAVYAPESDGNDPVAYAQFVAEKLKLPLDTPLKGLLG